MGLPRAKRLAFAVAVIGNDFVPFIGAGTGDEGHNRFSIAHVKNFVRNAGFDENEIARLIFDHVLQAWAELVADTSFDNVEHDFKIDVDMRPGDATRWDGRDI